MGSPLPANPETATGETTDDDNDNSSNHDVEHVEHDHEHVEHDHEYHEHDLDDDPANHDHHYAAA